MLSCLSAVAENQPVNKHRMNTEFSNFAARLRELILSGFHGADFDALAVELFNLQFAHCPAYQKECVAKRITPESISVLRGMTPSFARWKKIPFVTTSAFKHFEYSAIPFEKRSTVFFSSGTTEQKPSRHFHNAESLAVYEASLWTAFRQNFFADAKSANRAAKLICLTPPPAQVPYSSLVHMFETVRQITCEAGASVFFGKTDTDNSWILDFEASLKILQESVAQNQPLLLVGTAFSFVHLLDFLAENDLKFQLPENSRVMETGGYKNRSRTMPKMELHALIKKILGVPRENIICEYGMSELSSQAYDSVANAAMQTSRDAGISFAPTAANRSFHFPPWARVQIISPETGREVADGETGLIRIFDLANVFSVAAIQTEDLGIRRGDGFELIGRAQSAEARGCSLNTTEN
jgi:Acyl-protein synthetase, LuxE